MRLPQELFAEALWLEWDNHYGIIHKEKLPDLLRRYNLKLKKEKTLDDIQLAFGRGLKDTFGNTAKQIEQIAEEIDKSVSLLIGKMRLQSIKFDEMRIYW